MRFLLQAWLLAGLAPSLGLALKANMDIWNVDSSCSNYHDGTKDDTTGKTGGSDQTGYVQEAFDRALTIAEAAQTSLKYVLEKEPDPDEDVDGYVHWLRIAEAVVATFGFTPEPDEEEEATDKYWKQAFAIFDKIVTTLQAKQNDPVKGYNPKLERKSNEKPLVICGDNWDWLDKTDKWPGTEEKLEDIESLDELWEDGAKGVWFKANRIMAKSVAKEKGIMCNSDADAAVTSFEYDSITICDRYFRAAEKAVWTAAGGVEEGDTLSGLMKSLPFTIVHELAHWFGGPDKKKDGSYDLKQAVIDDLQAVDEKGMVLYRVKGKEKAYPKVLSSLAEDAAGAVPILAYGPRFIWNLARHIDGNPYTGPQSALYNADNYAAFAAMAYYETVYFTHDGEARSLEELEPEEEDGAAGTDNDD